MPHIYELPTHLEVEDQLIAGLTARQLLRLVIGASLAYAVWDQAPWLPDGVRLAIGAVLAVTGVVFAVLQPAGRALDQWLLAALTFVLSSRRLVWRPVCAPSRAPSYEPAWAELQLDPVWMTVAKPHHSEKSTDHSPFSRGLAWRERTQ